MENKSEEQLNNLLDDALDDMLNLESEGPSKVNVEETKEKQSDDDLNMDKFFADMKKQLDDINPEEAQAKITESVPEIFDLMQNLLSKELLYPALRDLSPKFDEWLSKNSEGLSKSDRKRYKKQRDIINEIIQVFDNESLGNQERFIKNLDLMERMQALGSPPSELQVTNF